jgi:CheY-like chemotaxis protein
LAVVGEAADALSALDAVGRLRPDVVVLDIQLPDLDGFEVARWLLRPGRPVIVLVSSRDSSTYRRRLARATLASDHVWTSWRPCPPLLAMLAAGGPGARLDRCATLSSGTVLSLLRTTDSARR